MANTIVRWNPFREIAAMQNMMDRLVDEAWQDVRPFNGNNTLPLDIHENEDSYIVVANIPGLNPDDININLHDNTLTIDVEIAQPEVAEGTRVLVQERFYGRLTRRFGLPQPVNTENVEATYDGGVLTLTLPKTAEAKPRQIPVRGGNKAIASNN